MQSSSSFVLGKEQNADNIADIIGFSGVRYFFKYPKGFRDNIAILSIISRYF